MNRKIFVGITFVILVSVVSACSKAPTAAPAIPTILPTQTARVEVQVVTPTPVPSIATVVPAPAQLGVITFTPPDNAVPLIANDETIGFFFVLNKKGPEEVKSPYQSTALFALANGKVGGTKVTSDGTEGNIVGLLCNEPTGCVTKVDGYVQGNLGVTIILAGKENPENTVLSAVINMFAAPNCGQSGCNTVYFWQDGVKQAFTEKPTAVQGSVPWTAVSVQTAMIGEPPANAKVIKIGTQVVGHAYTVSGKNVISVPEGTGGTILCFPNGGTANGEQIAKGASKTFTGTPSDSSTPEDLNRTINVSGQDVQVMMIYLSDLSGFSCQ